MERVKTIEGFKIENSVPQPFKRGTFYRLFKQMKNGESFTVERDKDRRRIYMAGYRLGHEIQTDKIQGGYRVWLVKKAMDRKRGRK